MECYSASKFRNKILYESTHMRSLEESKSQRQKGEWWVPVPEASQLALVVKNLPADAGDTRDVSLIPGPGRSPGGEHGNPLQYSGLENPADRGPWRAAVHGVTKSRIGLSDLACRQGLGEGKVKVVQSCPTLCHPTDHTVHGILQARTLEWVGGGSNRPRVFRGGRDGGDGHTAWMPLNWTLTDG